MRLHFLVLGLFVGLNTSAQFDFNPKDLLDKLDTPISSDRPGQALSSSTPGLATLQLQTGLNYSEFNLAIDNSSKSLTNYTQLRVGFTKKWELNVAFSYASIKTSTFIGEVKSSGFPSPELGIRYAFMKGSNWKPNLALQSSLVILSHRGDFQQKNFGSAFYLISSNQFDHVSVNTNLGLRFTGDGNKTVSIPYVLNFGFGLGDKFGAFIEGFGSISTFSSTIPIGNGFTVGTDAGLSYTPIKSLQIDVFGGIYDVITYSPTFPWFVELGVSWKYSVVKALAKKKINDFKGVFFGD